MELAVEIVDRIFLGPYESAKNFEWLKKNNITVVVNCTKNLDNCFEGKIEYFRIPVDDIESLEENRTFYETALEILPKVIELYNSGHNILIHCLAGVQRSASFVAAILCQMNFELDDAISFIQMKKPNTFFFGSKYHFITALNAINISFN